MGEIDAVMATTPVEKKTTEIEFQIFERPSM